MHKSNILISMLKIWYKFLEKWKIWIFKDTRAYMNWRRDSVQNFSTIPWQRGKTRLCSRISGKLVWIIRVSLERSNLRMRAWSLSSRCEEKANSTRDESASSWTARGCGKLKRNARNGATASRRRSQNAKSRRRGKRASVLSQHRVIIDRSSRHGEVDPRRVACTTRRARCRRGTRNTARNQYGRRSSAVFTSLPTYLVSISRSRFAPRITLLARFALCTYTVVIAALVVNDQSKGEVRFRERNIVWTRRDNYLFKRRAFYRQREQARASSASERRDDWIAFVCHFGVNVKNEPFHLSLYVGIYRKRIVSFFIFQGKCYISLISSDLSWF